MIVSGALPFLYEGSYPVGFNNNTIEMLIHNTWLMRFPLMLLIAAGILVLISHITDAFAKPLPPDEAPIKGLKPRL